MTYDPVTKNERTKVISYDARIREDDELNSSKLGEIPTMNQIANRSKEPFEKRILEDLTKNTKNSLIPSNPKNNATVNEVDNKGNALTFLDRPKAQACCIYGDGRVVSLPVLAIDLKNVYDSMQVNQSKTLEIKGLPNGKIIKVSIKKNKPNENGKGNWEVSCPIN